MAAMEANGGTSANPVGELDGFACLDKERRGRCGFPEFIFGEGKTARQLLAIAGDIVGRRETLLATRLESAAGAALAAAFPEGEHDPLARTFKLKRPGAEPRGDVVVLTAGTTDLPVAREAINTLDACEVGAELIADVGVAGIHRVLGKTERLGRADVVIVAAGMEGALPSVVAGLVACPIIAVPTSVGYGASFGGLAALLGMLNSCGSGVVATNIDNGFGAACAAARIINRRPRELNSYRRHNVVDA